ncbi:hypothetical protein PSm6_24490 [Pseudomonas solani]|uniref:Uncharacterized protein n=1 Tax=Pseudomonas solani TaxID=2731552 RepID=A0ABN6BTU9_9PSED|nr:hypothetical protein PSm6_24490 [Pseudomonas solani]
MTEKTSARIAVIADTSLQRHVLQQALAGNGYQVVLNSDPARLDEETLSACEVDLWLVDLAQSDDSPLVDNLMERASAPVLFGEGHAPSATRRITRAGSVACSASSSAWWATRPWPSAPASKPCSAMRSARRAWTCPAPWPTRRW